MYACYNLANIKGEQGHFKEAEKLAKKAHKLGKGDTFIEMMMPSLLLNIQLGKEMKLAMRSDTGNNEPQISDS